MMRSFIQLRDYQIDALKRMKNGCILNGGVGSGKSRTAIAYYYGMCGGKIYTEEYTPMSNPVDLYIITTARKRDTNEWNGDLAPFLLREGDNNPRYKTKVVVDSWNNIKKYTGVTNAFFIFDEQRVVGYGVWSLSFINISKHNRWILLSATPGDTWLDYIPVFIANGFYKNKTDFLRQHVVFSRFAKYQKVDRYLNTGKLIKFRKDILITMDFDRPTVQHHENILVSYNAETYQNISKKRWNIWKDEPIQNAADFCACLRKIVNSDNSRKIALLDIIEEHPKAIIFYNYDYELDILRELFENYPHAEWNGHKHEPIPPGDSWAYLVQYTAGCEGWNCITTDTIIFYSQNYSYKVMEQAAGRIDRLNTPFKDLYYYHLFSKSGIDLAISRALLHKKKFNETKYFDLKKEKEEKK